MFLPESVSWFLICLAGGMVLAWVLTLVASPRARDLRRRRRNYGRVVARTRQQPSVQLSVRTGKA